MFTWDFPKCAWPATAAGRFCSIVSCIRGSASFFRPLVVPNALILAAIVLAGLVFFAWRPP